MVVVTLQSTPRVKRDGMMSTTGRSRDPERADLQAGIALYNQRKYREAEEAFRKSVNVRGTILGRDHEDTLDSNHWLGLAVYYQDKYIEAERILQHALDGRNRTLGREHKRSLESEHWLALAIYRQTKYSEAERLFQQALDGRQKVLGKDNEDTLDSKYWLGLAHYRQDKFSTAERLFQQSLDGRKEILGNDNKCTLENKYWLGLALYDQNKYVEAEQIFQEAADDCQRTLGEDDIETLENKYWVGVALYWQNQYSKSEILLQEVAVGRERILGGNARDTLDTFHWLGLVLYDGKKYNKAEKMFQRTVVGQGKRLGEDHKITLDSKHWLGLALIRQKKYKEAERLTKETADQRERVLGRDNSNTLNTKNWRGITFYYQQKYAEAQELFQEVANGRERILRKDHPDTLNSKHWLGLALYRDDQYSKAEVVLREVAEQRDRILGKEHKDTLKSRQWLGRSLYSQEKYIEAEMLFRQTAARREKTLGRDNEATLDSKDFLGLTLYRQKKFSEAEGQFRHTLDGWERTRGKKHHSTRNCKHWLRRAISMQEQKGEKPRESATSRMRRPIQIHDVTLDGTRSLEALRFNTNSPPKDADQPTLAGKLDSFFLQAHDKRDLYTDSELHEISGLLKLYNQKWSKVPRTYTILRTIGSLHLLDDLISAGFSDYWLPATERSLPGCMLPDTRSSFVKFQSLVLTKSIDLEKGRGGQHCYYQRGETPPLETKSVLGRGGFGQVDRVLSLISFKEYARKQIPKAVAFRGQSTEDVRLFISEIEILKRLKHPHIVELIGSYTDSRYMGLIMSPVAEMDLSAYLARTTKANYSELRTFFGCLATALEYLHEQRVRHKDIKPGNILVDHGKILFTDFGLSFDFTDTKSTTVNMVNGKTPRYCAPEVAQSEPRNTMSDIWSLGIVFMEMIVVLKGKPVQYMDEFLQERGSRQALIRTNLDSLSALVAELQGRGDKLDNRALDWTQQMLLAESHQRPTASSLVASITDINQAESMRFCGICCAALDENSTDWEDPIE